MLGLDVVGRAEHSGGFDQLDGLEKLVETARENPPVAPRRIDALHLAMGRDQNPVTFVAKDSGQSRNEKWIVQLGTRIGWIEQLDDGRWTIDEANGRDVQGPRVDVSGLRARLVLGVGAQNGW